MCINSKYEVLVGIQLLFSQNLKNKADMYT